MRFIYKIFDYLKIKLIGLFKRNSDKRLRKRTLYEKNVENVDLNKNKYKFKELVVKIKIKNICIFEIFFIKYWII